MYAYDVVLLTEARYDQPTKTDWYIDQILLEDRLVAEALERKGLKVFRTDWANPNFDWTKAHCVVFRTTWDYFHRFEQFTKWLDEVSTKIRLINPVEQIRWNMDKHYLIELHQKGVNIPESYFIEPGEQATLLETHRELGWQNTVLKPAISGAGRHTYRLDPASIEEHEPIFQELIKDEAMLLQVFQVHVQTRGEVALMLFDGTFSHAVLKKAKPGDFRVQDDFGGTVHAYQASPGEISFAEDVVRLCHPLPVYARVDIIYDNENRIALSELELIEPELWFREYRPAAALMAEAIIRRLKS